MTGTAHLFLRTIVLHLIIVGDVLIVRRKRTCGTSALPRTSTMGPVGGVCEHCSLFGSISPNPLVVEGLLILPCQLNTAESAWFMSQQRPAEHTTSSSSRLRSSKTVGSSHHSLPRQCSLVFYHRSTQEMKKQMDYGLMFRIGIDAVVAAEVPRPYACRSKSSPEYVRVFKVHFFWLCSMIRVCRIRGFPENQMNRSIKVEVLGRGA
jgi:hypothetical protein